MSNLNEADLYTSYYLNQAGSGYGGIYSGPVYQRGYGIGSFLGGLFRAVIPLIRKGSIILGKECLKSGMDVVNDMENNEEVFSSLKRRGSELYQNIQKRTMDTMTGGKYNTSKIQNILYSPSATRTGRIKSKNIKNQINNKAKQQKKNKKAEIKKKNLRLNDIFA